MTQTFYFLCFVLFSIVSKLFVVLFRVLMRSGKASLLAAHSLFLFFLSFILKTQLGEQTDLVSNQHPPHSLFLLLSFFLSFTSMLIHARLCQSSRGTHQFSDRIFNRLRFHSMSINLILIFLLKQIVIIYSFLFI